MRRAARLVNTLKSEANSFATGHFVAFPAPPSASRSEHATSGSFGGFGRRHGLDRLGEDARAQRFVR